MLQLGEKMLNFCTHILWKSAIILWASGQRVVQQVPVHYFELYQALENWKCHGYLNRCGRGSPKLFCAIFG